MMSQRIDNMAASASDRLLQKALVVIAPEKSLVSFRGYLRTVFVFRWAPPGQPRANIAHWHCPKHRTELWVYRAV